METLQKQISLFGEEELTSLRVDFPVNRSAQPENAKERKMNAIYGQRCLEQYKRFNRDTLWGRTFPALLIGMEGWYSSKCRLTWRLRGTKSHRLYFQLAVSTLPTEEKEFGLLLTPGTVEIAEHPDKYIERQKKRTTEGRNGISPPGNKWNSLASQVVYGIMPTPNARDYKSPNKVNSHSNYSMLNETIHKMLLPTPTVMDTNNGDLQKIDQRRERCKAKGINGNGFGMTIGELANRGMLPTPALSNYKGASSTEALEARGRLKPTADNLADQFAVSGSSSQLNPRFVMEMMSFPVDWTELPFLSGGQNQLKPEVMP